MPGNTLPSAEKVPSTVRVSFSFPLFKSYTFFHPFGPSTLPVFGHSETFVSSVLMTLLGSAIISSKALPSWFERYDFAVSNHFLIDASVTTARMPETPSGPRKKIAGCRFRKLRYQVSPGRSSVNGVCLFLSVTSFWTASRRSFFFWGCPVFARCNSHPARSSSS